MFSRNSRGNSVQKIRCSTRTFSSRMITQAFVKFDVKNHLSDVRQFCTETINSFNNFRPWFDNAALV